MPVHIYPGSLPTSIPIVCERNHARFLWPRTSRGPLFDLVARLMKIYKWFYIGRPRVASVGRGVEGRHLHTCGRGVEGRHLHTCGRGVEGRHLHTCGRGVGGRHLHTCGRGVEGRHLHTCGRGVEGRHLHTCGRGVEGRHLHTCGRGVEGRHLHTCGRGVEGRYLHTCGLATMIGSTPVDVSHFGQESPFRWNIFHFTRDVLHELTWSIFSRKLLSFFSMTRGLYKGLHIFTEAGRAVNSACQLISTTILGPHVTWLTQPAPPRGLSINQFPQTSTG